MKIFATVFVSLLALTNAGSIESESEVEINMRNQLISEQIMVGLYNVHKQIKDFGLDPFHHQPFSIKYALLPLPSLFELSADLADIVVTGLGNIVVYNMTYGLLSSRLKLDVGITKIEIAIGPSEFFITLLGKKIRVFTNSKIHIVNLRVTGSVLLMNTGRHIRDADLDFTLGGIEFYGVVNAIGMDVSTMVHKLLTEFIPRQLKIVRNDVDTLINMLVVEIGNTILKYIL